jgi:phage repressor protein C with HTH and peptisase S24 domain
MSQTDQQALRTALSEAIVAANTNATAVARAIPRDQNYVRDFLRGKKESLGAQETARIETILGLEPGTLLVSRPAEQPLALRTRIISGRELVGARNLPIFSAAQGGSDGHTIVTFEAIDWMKRPAPLEKVQGGYGILIMNESMVPAFEPGDIALVNPHLPPIANKDVVLYSSSDLTGEVDCMIKRLLSSSGGEWRLRQFNPLTDFAVKRSDWPICHRTVGKYSAR